MELPKGKLYFLNNGGEYKELGRIENAEITPEEDKDDTEIKIILTKRNVMMEN